MNRSISRDQLSTRFLAACCLLALSPAPLIAQLSQGNHRRVVLANSTIPQQAEPLRGDRVSARGSCGLGVGRDLGLLVVSVRFTALLGVASASALAIYYDKERPYPTTCRPPAPDKWQHCYVGCQIATWCPLGSFSASILAVLKEVRDAMNRGEFSWPDVYATLRGAWDCASSESCEACCCERHGAPTTLQDRLVTAGCATCIFEMTDVIGCKLAVEMDGEHFLVNGTGIDDHGDAHAEEGLCNASRRALVSGKVEEGVFVSTAFKLLPK